MAKKNGGKKASARKPKEAAKAPEEVDDPVDGDEGDSAAPKGAGKPKSLKGQGEPKGTMKERAAANAAAGKAVPPVKEEALAQGFYTPEEEAKMKKDKDLKEGKTLQGLG